MVSEKITHKLFPLSWTLLDLPTPHSHLDLDSGTTKPSTHASSNMTSAVTLFLSCSSQQHKVLSFLPSILDPILFALFYRQFPDPPHHHHSPELFQGSPQFCSHHGYQAYSLIILVRWLYSIGKNPLVVCQLPQGQIQGSLRSATPSVSDL